MDGEYVAHIVKKAGAQVPKGFRHLCDGGGGVQGGGPSQVTFDILKASGVKRASEQALEPPRQPNSEGGKPQRATLSKNLHHSQQICEFLTGIAILRCDFDPHVTKYRKRHAFERHGGPCQTQNTYDGGGGSR